MAFLGAFGSVFLGAQKSRTTEPELEASIRIQFDQIWKYCGGGGGVWVLEVLACSAVSISTKRQEISHV